MEHQRYDWVLQKRRFKWSQLQSRLRSDKELREVELQHRMCVEEEIYLCELEQGSILGDSSNVDEDMRPYDGFMDPSKDGNQQKELMFETKREAMDPHGFETNYYSMFAGEIGKERQFADVFIKDEGGE